MTRARFVVVESEAELQRLLAEASAADRGVLLSGGRDEPPRRPGEEDHLALGLGRLDALVAFEPDDLTITAQAGMTVARLLEIAAEKDQRLAIEVVHPEERSLGAAVAMNEDGFIAALYGELREQVLGLRCITGDGRLLRAGGRVVKNVTGYDLRKLLCGSAGSLAAITELSFRLRPRPVAEATFVLRGLDRDEAPARVRELRDLPVKISGLALRRDRSGLLVALRAEGAPATLDALEKELVAAERLESAAARALWRELVEVPRPAAVLRYPPSRLSSVLDPALEAGDLVADLMAGRMRLPGRSGETTEELLARCRAGLIESGAVFAGAIEDRVVEPPAGDRPDSDALRALEQRIRLVFDPRGVLMRGRPAVGLP